MPMSIKWKEARKLCQDQQLQDVLKRQHNLGFLLRRIIDKKIYILYLLSLKERVKNIIRPFIK